jgi:hypothetical protein
MKNGFARSSSVPPIAMSAGADGRARPARSHRARPPRLHPSGRNLRLERSTQGRGHAYVSSGPDRARGGGEARVGTSGSCRARGCVHHPRPRGGGRSLIGQDRGGGPFSLGPHRRSGLSHQASGHDPARRQQRDGRFSIRKPGSPCQQRPVPPHRLSSLDTSPALRRAFSWRRPMTGPPMI